MSLFEIVAHRGGSQSDFPENTLESFQNAVDLGIDAVEMDVRLTKDHIPVVFHYTYLDEITSSSGTVFGHTYPQIEELNFVDTERRPIGCYRVPTLEEILATLDGKIGFEIEIKCPEPEAAEIIARLLNGHKAIWDQIEITSYEPAQLLGMRKYCPGLATDLLYPLSQPWMKLDVVAYEAAQRARLAQARGVHLHPNQLTPTVVDHIRAYGIEIHAWDVEGDERLQAVVDLGIPRICSDHPEEALAFRSSLAN